MPRSCRLRHAIALAGMASFARRAAPRFAPALTALALFALAAMAGLLVDWEARARWGLLLCAMAGLAFGLRSVARSSATADTLGALETQGGLPRGALGPLAGRPMPRGGLSARLWHRARGAAQSMVPTPLRLARPLARPLALAALAALAFVAVAPAGALARLGAAFSPHRHPLSAWRAVLVAVPPAYAGSERSRRALMAGATHQTRLLAGTRLILDIDGPPAGWRLVGPGSARAPDRAGRIAWVPIVPGLYDLREGTRQLLRLVVVFAPDRPPAIAWSAAPLALADGALAVAYTARDDHGPVAVTLEIAAGGRARSARIDAAAAGAARAIVDLAGDPAAGQVARMTLVARDGGGAIGRSATITARLPERVFTDPLARAIIAERGRLLGEPRPPRAGAAARRARLAGAARSRDLPATFAALVAAAYRLAYDRDAAAPAAVARLLWDAALALDDGGRAGAAATLERALARLDGAAAEGDRAALAALTAEVARALAALPPPAAGAAPAGDAADAGAMLEDIAERLAAGDAEGARAAIAALRAALEGARLAGAAAGAVATAGEARALAAEQAALAGRTPADEGTGAPLPGAGAQAALAARAEALGGAGAAAGEAMRAAARALGQGRAAAARAAQGEALAALDQAARAAEGAAAQASAAAGGARDPLGRALGGGISDGRADLADPARARQIEALRALIAQRAADPSRPPAERAYFERLLRRF